MIGINKYRLSILLLLYTSIGFSAESSKISVEAPEIEVERALTSLNNIDHRLRSIEILNNEYSASSSSLSAERSLENAQKYFTKNMFLAAIREALSYQRYTQSPDAGDYMQSLYILGRSYQSVNMDSQALHAYLRYVAIHTTADKPDNNRLLRVLHFAMPLAVSHSTVTNRDLKKLFSAISGVDLTKTQKAEVLYYAANSARESGEAEIASEWFNKSTSMSVDPNLRSRSRYFHALLLLDQKKFKEAENILLENVANIAQANKEFADYSYLALARMNMNFDKPKEAIKYYKEISEESTSYKDALFESIYAYLGLGENTDARSAAESFLTSFSGDSRSFQLKSLMSYFYIKDRKWDDAKLMMNESDQELTKYRVWVDQKYSKSSRLTQGDISDLITQGNTRVAHAPDVLTGHKLFGKLAEAKRRISDSRANLRNLIYTIGRTNIKQFKPSLIHRGEQYRQLSEEVLLVGHRLVSSVTNTIKPNLSELEKNALESSQKRRFELFSASSKIKRSRDVWANWSNALDLTKDIADKQKQLRLLQAKLSSTYLLNHEKAKGGSLDDLRLKSLMSSISKVEEQLGRALEVIRTQKTQQIIKQSPHRAVKSLHASYTNLLNEEYMLIDRFMQANRDTSDFALYDSFSNAWKRWEYVDKTLFQKVSMFDDTTRKQLSENIKHIQSLVVKHEALNVRQQILLSRLEEELSNSIKPILGFYHDRLDDHMSNTQKWQADLDWLEFEKNSGEKAKQERKFQLEQQILKNNMRDIGQGAL